MLSARASDLERDYPFGVVRQLLEGVLLDPAAAERALAGAAAPARAVFEFAGSDPGDQSGAFAALHGLYWVCVNLAGERPLAVVVDDIHWADSPSLRFLAYLARRLEGLPVLLAATLRTGEPGTDLALMAEIAEDAATTSVRPAPLSAPRRSRRSRAMRLGPDADEAFCLACHTTTGGNPLLLRQLLTALEAEGVEPDEAHADVVRAIGSRAIAASVVRRLSRLPAGAGSLGAGGGRARRRRRAGAGGRAGGAGRARRRGGGRAAVARGDPARRGAAGVRAPARPRRRLPRPPAGRARARARARRARAARRGGAGRPDRRPPAARAAAGRAVGRRDAAARRRRGAAPRRARPGGRPPAPRARRAAAGRRRAPGCCSSSASPSCSPASRCGRTASRRPTRPSPTPARGWSPRTRWRAAPVRRRPGRRRRGRAPGGRRPAARGRGRAPGARRRAAVRGLVRRRGP